MKEGGRCTGLLRHPNGLCAVISHLGRKEGKKDERKEGRKVKEGRKMKAGRKLKEGGGRKMKAGRKMMVGKKLKEGRRRKQTKEDNEGRKEGREEGRFRTLSTSAPA